MEGKSTHPQLVARAIAPPLHLLQPVLTELFPGARFGGSVLGLFENHFVFAVQPVQRIARHKHTAQTTLARLPDQTGVEAQDELLPHDSHTPEERDRIRIDLLVVALPARQARGTQDVTQYAG